MTPIESHPSASQAISNYLVFSAASEAPAFREKIMAAMEQIAPPVRYHDVIEAVYANRELASPAAKKLAASLARFSAGQGFMGFGQDQRGARIAAILDAEAGDQPKPISDEEAPAPQAHFAVAALEATPE